MNGDRVNNDNYQVFGHNNIGRRQLGVLSYFNQIVREEYLVVRYTLYVDEEVYMQRHLCSRVVYRYTSVLIFGINQKK